MSDDVRQKEIELAEVVAGRLESGANDAATIATAASVIRALVRMAGHRETIELMGALADALIWCSGSADFSREGQAGEGWANFALPRLTRALEWLKQNGALSDGAGQTGGAASSVKP